MEAFAEHPELVVRTQRITAAALAEQLASATPPVVIDVRAPGEFAEEHIHGSRNEPLSRLADRAGELVSEGRSLVVHCASGYRSSVAISVLLREAGDGVLDLVGGLDAWRAAALPIDKGGPA